MSTVQNASSSEDLLRARAFAVRLTSSSSVGGVSPQPAVAYVRFRPMVANTPVPAVPERPAAPAPPPSPAVEVSPSAILKPFVSEVGETRSRRVQRFLSWCGEVCETPAVLLMDSYALLIGASGPLSQERAEALGAHIMVALETACRMFPDGKVAPAIAVEFDSRWLTGFRATLSGDEVVTFGVLGDRIPDLPVRALVAETAGKTL